MIKRRTLLITGAVGGGALATVAHQSWLPILEGFKFGAQYPYFRPEGWGAQLLGAMDTLGSLDAVGEVWLASLTEKPELAELMRSFVTRLPAGHADLSLTIATAVRQDFINGVLCEVQGWRLSLTECQMAGMRRLAIEAGLIQSMVEEGPEGNTYTLGEVAMVEGWGPKETNQGEVFNPQLDGHSGIWLKAKGAPAHARVMIDGHIATTSVSEKSVSSGLYGAQQERILANPGRYEIALVDPIRKIKQPVGYFEVRGSGAEAPGQAALCVVDRWGPQRTRSGVAANVQPDGSMGLWLRSECIPAGVKLMFGDDPLAYRRKDFGLTALVPVALLGAPGRIPLSLHLPGTGEKLVFGHLVIE